MSNCIDHLVADNTIFKEEELANCFNDFFAHIGNIANTSVSAACIPRTPHSVFLQPTLIAEFIRVFEGIKNSHSRDADDLQIKPIKYVVNEIAPVISHIFSIAISTGIFLNNMQVAKVTEIHKGGDKNTFSNYRSVSILPIFSKGLEKLINARIDNFCSKHNL